MNQARSDCRSCGESFAFDSALYRCMPPPALCPGCHRARQQRMVAAEGEVTRVGPACATATLSDGRQFFWTFGGDDDPPKKGSRVHFLLDPEEAPPPGRLPRARSVTLVTAPPRAPAPRPFARETRVSEG